MDFAHYCIAINMGHLYFRQTFFNTGAYTLDSGLWVSMHRSGFICCLLFIVKRCGSSSVVVGLTCAALGLQEGRDPPERWVSKGRAAPLQEIFNMYMIVSSQRAVKVCVYV